MAKKETYKPKKANVVKLKKYLNKTKTDGGNRGDS